MDQIDIFFIVAGGMCVLLFALMTASYATTMKPKGQQNQSLIGLVIGTSVAFGIIGWLLAVWGLKGNPAMQTQFLLAFAILILFPTTVISAALSASQLYGLRDAIATNTTA